MLNIPNILTLIRLALIPALVVVYFMPGRWAAAVATAIFVVAALTDLLDGYLARRLEQASPLGAFLDPVADKLVVAAALVLLASDPVVHGHVWDNRVFVVMVLVIIGREITVSALREWMAEIGKRKKVAVSSLGKVKTVMQMVAISFLLFRGNLWSIPIMTIGEILLYLAAILTLMSMLSYLRAAWPALSGSGS
ncbi:MAG: CDP-diacylglycerol--glycerol-3-phosphate 3-phosphatidyltransferase [Acidiferrobacterales bacterium]|nr:CDP-diacylglycerol--glycerol-3-phosphate 3-phosphatidyltransferase [Acidiferrobacterales bacterium]